MARPKEKQELLKAGTEQYQKLCVLIDSLPEAERNVEFDFSNIATGKEHHWNRDKNIRDILIHLYEWHQLLIIWIKSNQSGEEKSFLPEEYNWRTYGDMNWVFWEKHQNTSYGQSRDMLEDSHEAVMELINEFSNEELFTKKHFTWTGNTNLGSYFVSNTSSHYAWAIKKIMKHQKSIKLIKYKE